MFLNIILIILIILIMLSLLFLLIINQYLYLSLLGLWDCNWDGWNCIDFHKSNILHLRSFHTILSYTYYFGTYYSSISVAHEQIYIYFDKGNTHSLQTFYIIVIFLYDSICNYWSLVILKWIKNNLIVFLSMVNELVLFVTYACCMMSLTLSN